MKPETEAKAIIALIISLIAFGCGSGAGILMGLSQNDALNTTEINNTHEAQELPQIPRELPQIQTTENMNITAEPQTTTGQNNNQNNNNSESVYIENNRTSGNNSTGNISQSSQ